MSMPNELKPSILIVDDDRSYRNLLRSAFPGSAYNVSTAEDGNHALQLLETQQQGYDLVITDLQMPNLDGMSLIEVMKSRFPSVPVIVMSAFMEDERYNRLSANERFRCLPKPFRLAEILQVADSLLHETHEA